eukprot:gb/GECG01001369.1/.p1 GENE.gb/GECG01001369.1/~~gb/GECG01001369.1/.p1  ORF type:complete len:170 (+),score=19.33 gb/GECG01001369.1/:1-510(+)
MIADLETALEMSYETMGSNPLIVVDDINFAPQDEVQMWVLLGRTADRGNRKSQFHLFLITSPGEGMHKINKVSDHIYSKKVIFGNLKRDETNEYLVKAKGIEDPESWCWIWHVIGSKPGDLNKYAPVSSVSKQQLYMIRDDLLVLAREAYAEARGSVEANRGKESSELL